MYGPFGLYSEVLSSLLLMNFNTPEYRRMVRNLLGIIPRRVTNNASFMPQKWEGGVGQQDEKPVYFGSPRTGADIMRR